MSVFDDGEALMARLNANERKRAARKRDEVAVVVRSVSAKTGREQIFSQSVPRWKMRELGFDV